MPKHLLSPDLSAQLSDDRISYLQDQAEYLAELAFFNDAKRLRPLAAQLDGETSKFERGFLLGYIAARGRT